MFHFAGKGDIVPSIDNPKEYFETNANGTLNILELSRNSKFKTWSCWRNGSSAVLLGWICSRNLVQLPSLVTVKIALVTPPERAFAILVPKKRTELALTSSSGGIVVNDI